MPGAVLHGRHVAHGSQQLEQQTIATEVFRKSVPPALTLFELGQAHLLSSTFEEQTFNDEEFVTTNPATRLGSLSSGVAVLGTCHTSSSRSLGPRCLLRSS